MATGRCAALADKWALLVWERDMGRCVRCGIGLAGLVISYSCHHRLLRSQGGYDEPANRIMLCGTGTTGCHGWAHHNRDAARPGGYILLPTTDGRTTDPATVPVWSFLWQHKIVLDNQGGLTLAA
jgi:hypothetical protein